MRDRNQDSLSTLANESKSYNSNLIGNNHLNNYNSIPNNNYNSIPNTNSSNNLNQFN